MEEKGKIGNKIQNIAIYFILFELNLQHTWKYAYNTSLSLYVEIDNFPSAIQPLPLRMTLSGQNGNRIMLKM